MAGTSSQLPTTVEQVFNDYIGRRASLIKALTTEIHKLHKLCDPDKEELCLYGFPDGRWEVTLPFELVPSELPEPLSGINFERDTMEPTNWRTFIAIYSDAWLYSVAFYFGGRFAFDQGKRRQLFEMINNVPTVHEVVLNEAPPVYKRSARKNKDKISGGMVNVNEVVRDEAPPVYKRSARKNKDKISGGMASVNEVVRDEAPPVNKKRSARSTRKNKDKISGGMVCVNEVVPDEAPPVKKKRSAQKNKDKISEGLPPRPPDSNPMVVMNLAFGHLELGATRPPRPPDSNPEVVMNPAFGNAELGATRDAEQGVTQYAGQGATRDAEQGATRNAGQGAILSLCGTCGDTYIEGEFWIFCDTCVTWYHGDCVNITPEEADNIEQYKCPRCCSKKARI